VSGTDETPQTEAEKLGGPQPADTQPDARPADTRPADTRPADTRPEAPEPEPEAPSRTHSVLREIASGNALADRIAVMYDGRIVGTVSPDIAREDIGLMMAGAHEPEEASA
jgi:hypothetical protein